MRHLALASQLNHPTRDHLKRSVFQPFRQYPVDRSRERGNAADFVSLEVPRDIIDVQDLHARPLDNFSEPAINQKSLEGRRLEIEKMFVLQFHPPFF